MDIVEHIAQRGAPCLVLASSLKGHSVNITRTLDAVRNGEKVEYCVVSPEDAQAVSKTLKAKPTAPISSTPTNTNS